MAEISKAVEGRFVPVYRDHTKTDFWEKSKFVEMKKIAENGRVRNWPSPAMAWITDVQDARLTISDMLNKVLNEGMNVVEAAGYEIQGDVVILKEQIDQDRAIVTLRADEDRVAIIADPLRAERLRPGDHLLLDTKAGYLLEKLPRVVEKLRSLTGARR